LLRLIDNNRRIGESLFPLKSSKAGLPSESRKIALMQRVVFYTPIGRIEIFADLVKMKILENKKG
jgi:hypothetical protein